MTKVYMTTTFWSTSCILEGGKMQVSPKLELCLANQDQIRNQRHRLRRNRLFLGRKAGGGGVSRPVPHTTTLIRKYSRYLRNTVNTHLHI